MKVKTSEYNTPMFVWNKSLKSQIKNKSEFAQNWLTRENYHYYSTLIQHDAIFP